MQTMYHRVVPKLESDLFSLSPDRANSVTTSRKPSCSKFQCIDNIACDLCTAKKENTLELSILGTQEALSRIFQGSLEMRSLL